MCHDYWSKYENTLDFGYGPKKFLKTAFHGSEFTYIGDRARQRGLRRQLICFVLEKKMLHTKLICSYFVVNVL